MSDQEAREKTAQDTIAEALVVGRTDLGTIGYRDLARYILDALAADGWAVVRAPFVKAYPWEPVPEGSDQ